MPSFRLPVRLLLFFLVMLLASKLTAKQITFDYHKTEKGTVTAEFMYSAWDKKQQKKVKKKMPEDGFLKTDRYEDLRLIVVLKNLKWQNNEDNTRFELWVAAASLPQKAKGLRLAVDWTKSYLNVEPDDTYSTNEIEVVYDFVPELLSEYKEQIKFQFVISRIGSPDLVGEHMVKYNYSLDTNKSKKTIPTTTFMQEEPELSPAQAAKKLYNEIMSLDNQEADKKKAKCEEFLNKYERIDFYMTSAVSAELMALASQSSTPVVIPDKVEKRKEDTPTKKTNNPPSVTPAPKVLSAEDKAFEKMEKQPTLEAITTFLTEYPNTKYLTKADELLWTLVTEKNETSFYNEYLALFSQGKYVNKAREKICSEVPIEARLKQKENNVFEIRFSGNCSRLPDFQIIKGEKTDILHSNWETDSLFIIKVAKQVTLQFKVLGKQTAPIDLDPSAATLSGKITISKEHEVVVSDLKGGMPPYYLVFFDKKRELSTHEIVLDPVENKPISIKKLLEQGEILSNNYSVQLIDKRRNFIGAEQDVLLENIDIPGGWLWWHKALAALSVGFVVLGLGYFYKEKIHF